MASPNFFPSLRLKSIFDPMLGNDLPQQGGITGNLPLPPQLSQGGIFGPQSDLPDFMGPTPAPSPLFNPEPMDVMKPGVSLSQPMQPPGMGDRVAQEMARLYTPETAATNKFNEMLGNYPDREQYKPSMLRRIGSALTAVGGSFDGRGGFRMNPNAMEAGMNLLNEPFNKKLTDWKNQIGPAYQSASLERQNNANERTMAYQTISQQLRAEADEQRALKNERDAAIRQQRADVYEFKARNPNLKLIMTKGGNVQAFNPLTGETKDTGIPTGSLTEADKLSLQQEHALERIQETGGQQRQTETLRQTGRQDIAETRGWKPYEETLADGTKRTFMYNEITGETRDKAPGGTPQGATPVKPGGNTTGRTELPTQTKVRQYNLARELKNTRPDLAKFIQLGPGTNEFRLTQPGKNWFNSPTGPTEDQIAEIETSIYGAPISKVVPQPTRTGKEPTTGVQNTPDGNPNRPPVQNTTPAGGPPAQQGAKPGPGNILVKTQTNARTGAKRTLRSIDGGKTWEVMNAPANQ